MASFGDQVTYQLELEIARGENSLGSRKLMMRVQFIFNTTCPDCVLVYRGNKVSCCKVSNKIVFLHHLISMTSWDSEWPSGFTPAGKRKTRRKKETKQIISLKTLLTDQLFPTPPHTNAQTQWIKFHSNYTIICIDFYWFSLHFQLGLSPLSQSLYSTHSPRASETNKFGIRIWKYRKSFFTVISWFLQTHHNCLIFSFLSLTS